ncbi:MAG: MarR family transcriptional regulator [Lachnospiraceae bacterium]|nr:MarR family transcriptional regulator [Lachnospiraceae bacterium]
MEEKRIGFEIRCINNLFKRYIELNKPPELDETTGIHGWAIKYLYENRDKEIFQKDFETRFSIRRSTATNMLKLMEAKGLIERVSVPKDARLKKIVLTGKAINIHKQIEKNIMDFEKQLSRGLSEEEMETFFRILDKIKNNMEEIE